MERHLAWGLSACLLVAPCAGCDGGGEADGDGGADADEDEDGAPDSGDGGDGGDGGPDHAARVLLLDQDLRHRSTWVDLIEAFEAAGAEVDYRRFYPHLTEADVAAVDGLHPYAVVVLAAGRTPGDPGGLMRLDEVDPAVRHAEDGGALLLVPQPGYEDGTAGENDFFVQTRILEELDVPVRAERNTVIGIAWPMSGAHAPTMWAYPTPLEMQIGYPYLLTPEGERIAGGKLPILRVASPEVQVLLHTWDVGFLWRRTTGPVEGQTEHLTEERPAAALACAGSGFVAVVPRGPLTVTAASDISDKPAMDAERREVNLAWTHGLARQLLALVREGEELEVTSTHEGDALFSVEAPNADALDPSGEVLSIATRVSTREVPEAPPDGQLLDLPGGREGERPLPGWASAGGGRVAYGNLPADLATMDVGFQEIRDHGIDVLMTTTNPYRLLPLEGADLEAARAVYEEVAALAEDAGARWFIGDHFVAPFHDAAGDYPVMVGAHGGHAGSPDPIAAAYWDEVWVPTFALVGELAADYPGIAGLHVDLELYGGPTWHHDGWAFSAEDLEVFLAGVDDAGLAEELRAASAAERLALLVDRGRLGDYFGALEDAAADLGRRCREAARASAPDLELMVYVPGFPNSWFYTGLLRGLGEPGRPVAVLSYDGWALAPTRELWADGVDLSHLGGAIVGNFSPDQLEDVLVSLATGNDGYWYFMYNDFSATNPAPPALHGSGEDYWAAVDGANARLAGER